MEVSKEVYAVINQARSFLTDALNRSVALNDFITAQELLSIITDLSEFSG